MEHRNLDESHNGLAITIDVGENISINLNANPSTGYRWTVKENDESVLPLISREFNQFEAEAGKVGVGGILNLTFKGIKVGHVNLKLEYSKPMAGESDIVKFFELDVTVK